MEDELLLTAYVPFEGVRSKHGGTEVAFWGLGYVMGNHELRFPAW
jgi:hypothetical protein